MFEGGAGESDLFRSSRQAVSTSLVYSTLDRNPTGNSYRDVAVDQWGNTYAAVPSRSSSTNHGSIVKYSPSGQILREIPVAGAPSRLAFDFAGRLHVIWFDG